MDTGFMLLSTRQYGVPVILRELMLPDGFDPVTPSFTIRNVTTELSRPRLINLAYQRLTSRLQSWLVGIQYYS
ncbi:unnamed protein product [Schistosoma mattheei]|uniref:Uncharacterized protein n=1 Tax=Schistosoma mattheei TaxID=31246 RepID=A0A3P8FIC6_9TREM|nr:unnamed protein product [Schistosoma mattheei]